MCTGCDVDNAVEGVEVGGEGSVVPVGFED